MDLRRLDLNLLHVLHVLLEERSVSRAAERLHLSQSATSHALARLRRHFNDPLLTRTRNGMQPTTRAEALAPGVARVLAEISHLIGPDRFDPASISGLVRIAALTTATMNLIPDLAAQLAHRSPGLRIDCCQWTEQTFDAIETGKIDIAIGTEWQDQRDWVQSETLMREEYVCVVRKDHPLTTAPVTRESFEAWPHLIVESISERANTVNQVLTMLGVTRRSIFTTHHAATAHLIAEKSDMILTVTRTIAEHYDRTGNVTLLTPPVDVGTVPICMFWHPRTATSDLHRWMRSQIREIAAG